MFFVVEFFQTRETLKRMQHHRFDAKREGNHKGHKEQEVKLFTGHFYPSPGMR
jgi:hypothetical protein